MLDIFKKFIGTGDKPEESDVISNSELLSNMGRGQKIPSQAPTPVMKGVKLPPRSHASQRRRMPLPRAESVCKQCLLPMMVSYGQIAVTHGGECRTAYRKTKR